MAVMSVTVTMSVVMSPTVAVLVVPGGDTLPIVFETMCGAPPPGGFVPVAVGTCAGASTNEPSGTNNSGNNKYRNCNQSAFIKSL